MCVSSTARATRKLAREEDLEAEGGRSCKFKWPPTSYLAAIFAPLPASRKNSPGQLMRLRNLPKQRRRKGDLYAHGA